jgi:hypothetical protein
LSQYLARSFRPIAVIREIERRGTVILGFDSHNWMDSGHQIPRPSGLSVV